jgi:putative ATP-grasp target RiPP
MITSPPWGLRLMTDRLPTSLPTYAGIVLDPITQTAQYFDTAGQVVEMGKHGGGRWPLSACPLPRSPGAASFSRRSPMPSRAGWRRGSTSVRSD